MVVGSYKILFENTPKKKQFSCFLMLVHAEIIDFCDFLSPTPEEQTSRNAAIESVSDVIKYIWGNAKVRLVICLYKTSNMFSCTFFCEIMNY